MNFESNLEPEEDSLAPQKFRLKINDHTYLVFKPSLDEVNSEYKPLTFESGYDSEDEPEMCKMKKPKVNLVVKSQPITFDTVIPVLKDKIHRYEFTTEKNVGVLIGKSGNTIRKLKKITQCDIEINDSKNLKKISISNSNEDLVKGAYERIFTLLNSPRVPDFFLGIPLGIRYGNKIQSFFNSELKCHTKGVDLNLIRPSSAHISLTMLHLGSQERLFEALKLFSSLQSKIHSLTANKPIIISWDSKLECFSFDGKSSIDSARVLFAKPLMHSMNQLKEIRDLICEEFQATGFTNEFEPIEPHLTLARMNSPNDLTALQSAVRVPFDVWEADSIEFSQRFVSYDKNGYYHKVGEIKLT